MSHATPPVSHNVTPIKSSASFPTGTTTTAAGYFWEEFYRTEFLSDDAARPARLPTSTRSESFGYTTPNNSSYGSVDQGQSNGQGLSTHTAIVNLPPPESSLSYGPALPETISSSSLTSPSINIRQRKASLSFPGNITTTPFVSSRSSSTTGFQHPSAHPAKVPELARCLNSGRLEPYPRHLISHYESLH